MHVEKYSHRGNGYVTVHQIHAGLALRTTVLTGDEKRKTGVLLGPAAHESWQADMFGKDNAAPILPSKKG